MGTGREKARGIGFDFPRSRTRDRKGRRFEKERTISPKGKREKEKEHRRGRAVVFWRDERESAKGADGDRHQEHVSRKRERNERDELAIVGQLFTKRRAMKCRIEKERGLIEQIKSNNASVQGLILDCLKFEAVIPAGRASSEAFRLVTNWTNREDPQRIGWAETK